MYSEDLYSAHTSDHSILAIYCAVFAIFVVGVLLRMTFHSGNGEYVHTER